MAIPRMIYLGTEKMNNPGTFNADGRDVRELPVRREHCGICEIPAVSEQYAVFVL